MLNVNNGFTGLEDFDNLMRQLEGMGHNIDQQAIDKALEAGAIVLRDKIENHPNMPVSNKNKAHAKDNIIYLKVKDGQYDVGAKGDYFYLLFHEVGAKAGTYQNSKGTTLTTPAIPAKPFMRPSLENNVAEIEEAMGRALRGALGL